MTDEDYMRRAIELAKKGEGFTNPNPCVGAVIVKEGRIIAEGYHHKYGGLHAERDAISNLKESAKGATLFVTLEPCCHYGKQPPCTEAIVEQQISRVVIGSRDPNPLVAGKGSLYLKNKGIDVTEDFLREECDKLNDVFFHYITTKTPYVVMKYAMTADGKTSTKTGDSKWISGEKSRQKVQQMRHRYMAIMAGIGTVLADDPLLTVRIDKLNSPIRVICDSSLKTPITSKLVTTANQYETLIAYAKHDPQKEKALIDKGIELIYLPDNDNRVDIKNLFELLGQRGIDSVFVEGGGILNDSCMRTGMVKRLEVFVSPKIFGGKMAKSPIEGEGIDKVDEAVKFSLENSEQIGEDVLLTYKR